MKYTVWVEGSNDMGNIQPASCLGTIEASSFIEAARELWRKAYTPAYEGEPYTADDYFSVRDGVPTIWGCRCFDNEADARESFG